MSLLSRYLSLLLRNVTTDLETKWVISWSSLCQPSQNHAHMSHIWCPFCQKVVMHHIGSHTLLVVKNKVSIIQFTTKWTQIWTRKSQSLKRTRQDPENSTMKTSRVNRICWGAGKYRSICLFGMYVGNMRHTEPRYMENLRDVCWGSGIVALDDFEMFVPFPIVYAVGGWWTKPQHILWERHKQHKSWNATIPDPQHTSRGLSSYCGSVCLTSPTHILNKHIMIYFLDPKHIMLTLDFNM